MNCRCRRGRGRRGAARVGAGPAVAAGGGAREAQQEHAGAAPRAARVAAVARLARVARVVLAPGAADAAAERALTANYTLSLADEVPVFFYSNFFKRSIPMCSCQLFEISAPYNMVYPENYSCEFHYRLGQIFQAPSYLRNKFETCYTKSVK